MSSTYENAINQQYNPRDLERVIVSLLQPSAPNTEEFSLDDIAAVDQFHIRGQAATRELAHQAELSEGMSVLDLGSGLGGPARILAANWNCQVVGIDLTNAYVQAARTLTEHVGLDDRVTFLHGNALELPFDTSHFDAVWLQHVSMNVEDKETLFREAHRVLRPGGRLAVHEIAAGPCSPLHHPVPWADDPSLSFLTSPTRMRDLIEEAGFSVPVWTDTSAESLTWFREQAPSAPNQSPDTPPPLLHLLMGENARQKQQNVVRNLEEDRIVVVQGVARRPGGSNTR